MASEAVTLNEVKVRQLAEAFELVAKVNHYMVGVVHQFTREELEAAEQLLIDKQNAGLQVGTKYRLLDRALDLLDNERTRLLQRT